MRLVLVLGLCLLGLGCGVDQSAVCDRLAQKCPSFYSRYPSKQACEDDVTNSKDLELCLECVEDIDCAHVGNLCADNCAFGPR